MIRVVVVDDDYMVARVHGAFVDRTPGFTVVGAAHNGADALGVIRRLQPDLVLLDVYMPDMTGLEVLRQLRASPGPEADVDVLVITAANDAPSVQKSLHGGAAGYLIKPFHYQDLKTRLEYVATRHGRLAELPQAQDGAAQQEVDRLFAPDLPREVSAAPLPKGLSQETAALVRQVLRAAGPDGISAGECAERIGLSRVSARRYLEHLASVGSAQVSARYGGTGRPERRFRTP